MQDYNSKCGIKHAFLAIGLLTLSGPIVYAQDDDEEETLALDDVTVTARRVQESLQDVPVAVTSFSREELEDAQAENLDSLKGAVPNMNLVQGRGSASSANIYIRGIGQPDALQTFDPGVGVYVDGVYMSRIQGALMSLHDVERIEVLRGPQGTLYGKNTIGGAVNVITRRPDEVTSGEFRVLAGDYSATSASTYFKGALSARTNASFSALYRLDNGFVTDAQTGQHYNDRDNTSMRFLLNSQLTDKLSLDFSLDYTDQENALTLGRSEAPLIALDFADLSSPVLLNLPSSDEYDFTGRTSFTDDENQELRHMGASFTLNYNLNDFWDLKSITAYRDLDSDSFIDIDATELELGDVFVGVDQQQVSQELQFLFNSDSGFNAVLGMFYMQEDVPSMQEAYADDFLLFGGVPLDFLRTIDDDLETTSYAFFAQGNWTLSDRWGLTAGIRYSKDEKDYKRTTSTFSTAGPFLEGTFAFADSDSWDSVTPMVSIDYQINDSNMLYASASKGFKSGGFNGRANAESDVSSFDPETVWTYELGGKSQFLDNRLRLNYAIFTSDYEDFQARVAEDISSFPVINAAELDISGAELELTWLLSASTTVYSSIGYLDSDYKKFFDFRQPDLDRSDDVPPFSPDWTFRIGMNHAVYLDGGAAIRFGLNGNYTGDMYLSVDNQEALTQDDYWLFNAYAIYDFANPAWSITIGGKNLTDEVYKIDAQEFSSVANIQTAYYGDPRTWYAALNYRF
ncbi:TonB-dependent receptor [Marinicella sp. S1101]|uniref:TonB-dependent receptor n=1 Tax=Marinicella marina TaxID=2996016 RepID=UPI002260B082|nr:TonB-dependent receptor [Marinicella marina]MCX7552474.1 TonB-dependent receptor [Marinicella marina]MDJ1139350.1 TonB-dependent receptor [Marinicella marina]